MELKTIAKTNYKDGYWLVWLTGYNDGFKTLTPSSLLNENKLKNDIQVVLETTKGERLGDAVCHYGSYGSENGLWEIMIDVLPRGNDVMGHLSFSEVTKYFDKKIRKIEKAK